MTLRLQLTHNSQTLERPTSLIPSYPAYLSFSAPQTANGQRSVQTASMSTCLPTLSPLIITEITTARKNSLYNGKHYLTLIFSGYLPTITAPGGLYLYPIILLFSLRFNVNFECKSTQGGASKLFLFVLNVCDSCWAGNCSWMFLILIVISTTITIRHL